jgi:hypothetical protein
VFPETVLIARCQFSCVGRLDQDSLQLTLSAFLIALRSHSVDNIHRFDDGQWPRYIRSVLLL